MDEVISVVVLCLVGVMLGKAAFTVFGSPTERRIVVSLWRAARLRHLATALPILAAVITVYTLVRNTGAWASVSLASLLGIGTGNVILKPFAESTDAVATTSGWVQAGVFGAGAAYLLLFTLLLPAFAYREEVEFRAGLHSQGWARRTGRAVKFGAMHLLMFIPLGAAVALAAGGALFGAAYLRSYTQANGAGMPTRLARVQPQAVSAYRTVRKQAVVDDAEAAAVFDTAVVHTVYNAVGVSVLFLVLVVAALP